MAGTLHDVGKIAVSDSVLLKPCQLTAEERDMMKAHAVIGYEMLSVPATHCSTWQRRSH